MDPTDATADVPGTTVRAARDRYLAASGYLLADYTAKTFPVRLGPLRFRLPNPGRLPIHDLHHVATGYDSGVLGEAEISAFELRNGCGSALIGVFCVLTVALAFVLAPRRTARAWRVARGRRSLYASHPPYESLLAMDVVDLRRLMALPAEGLRAPSNGV